METTRTVFRIVTREWEFDHAGWLPSSRLIWFSFVKQVYLIQNYPFTRGWKTTYKVHSWSHYFMKEKETR